GTFETMRVLPRRVTCYVLRVACATDTQHATRNRETGSLFLREFLSVLRRLLRQHGLENTLPARRQLSHVQQLPRKARVEHLMRAGVDTLQGQVRLRALLESPLVAGLHHAGGEHTQVPAGA